MVALPGFSTLPVFNCQVHGVFEFDTADLRKRMGAHAVIGCPKCILERILHKLDEGNKP